jgi:CheY-like chemotaxis protein
LAVGIVLVLTIVVVATKGLTTYWLGLLTTQVREQESEEVEVLQRLQAVEATKLHLEREKEALEREKRLLDDERDLVAQEIQKLGVEPLPETSIDEVETPEPVQGATADGEGQPEDPSRASEDVGAGSTDAGVYGRSRVLVVDDNEELRKLLEKMLSRTYEVTGAADGYEALTQIVKEKQHYDVVVTDLKMPNVNGVALMQSLPKGLPVIVISGFLDREEFQKALEEEAPFATFQKPFKTSDLKDAIQRAVESQVEGVPAGRGSGS